MPPELRRLGFLGALPSGWDDAGVTVGWAEGIRDEPAACPDGTRRYHTITIQGGPQTITALNLAPDDLSGALAKIKNARPGMH